MRVTLARRRVAMERGEVEQTIQSLDHRVTRLETAVIGTIKEPGIAEMQRNQSKDMLTLRNTLESLSDNVGSMAKARQTEMDMRAGEKKAFRTFRNLAFFALVLLAGGGATLGNQLLNALRELGK